MKRIALAVVIFMLMLVCVELGCAQEKNVSEKATEKAAAAEKKISVICLSSEMHSTTYVLEDVEQAEFNGIKCLKGKHVDLYWVANRTVYIPVSQISVIIEYDSLSQYKESLEKYHKKQMESE